MNNSADLLATDVLAVQTGEQLSAAPFSARAPLLSGNKDRLAGRDIHISFYVACFHEEPNIYGALETLALALVDNPASYEIIVVDDASRDGSAGEVRRFQCDRPDVPVELVVREHNLGLALNYVECAFAARGTWYRLICGDNIEPVETLRAALGAIGSADMVLAYPVRRVGFSASRNLISKTYTQLVNLITGHRLRYYNFPAIHRRANVLRWHSRSRVFRSRPTSLRNCSTMAPATLKSLSWRLSVPTASRPHSTCATSCRSVTPWWRWRLAVFADACSAPRL